MNSNKNIVIEKFLKKVYKRLYKSDGSFLSKADKKVAKQGFKTIYRDVKKVVLLVKDRNFKNPFEVEMNKEFKEIVKEEFEAVFAPIIDIEYGEMLKVPAKGIVEN